MSAAQPKPAEPSMEEILASIRRIISDDQTTKDPAVTPHAAPAPRPAEAMAVNPIPVVAPVVAQKPVFHDDDEDIMDLAPKSAAFKKAPEPHMILDDPIPSDVVFEDPAPVFAAPVTAKPVQMAKPAAPSKQDELDAIMAGVEFDPAPQPAPAFVAPDRLVSPTTDRMVSTAFSSLASTVLANNTRTLESLVEEMMRPMIKNWLDDNLPSIVERLIKSEIERVARGGR
jgi:uncharacterized protein